MKTIYLATMESRSFSFAAVGKTKKEAIAALIRGLDAHTRQFNLDPEWYSVEDDIGCTPMDLGQPYRDYAPILEG